MLTSFFLLPHFFLPLHLWVLCFFHLLHSGATGLTLNSAPVLLFHEAVPWDFLFFFFLVFFVFHFLVFPPSPLLLSLTPIRLDQIQSDVTLNDFIFTEDIRRACITDITYLRLKAWASAPCPFLAAIKWQ